MQDRKTNWVELVKEARKSEQGVQKLLNELIPTFYSLSYRLASQLVVDAAQAAAIAAWKAIDKVDLDRPETVRNFLITAGVRGIRSEVKRYLSQTNRDTMVNMGDTLIDKPYEVEEFPYDFPPLLQEYLECVRKLGTFRGVHAMMAKKHKVPVQQIRLLFHDEAMYFVKRYNIKSNSKVNKDDIVDDLLDGLL